MSNFISSCDMNERLHRPGKPPLDAAAVGLLRAFFTAPPHTWRRPHGSRLACQVLPQGLATGCDGQEGDQQTDDQRGGGGVVVRHDVGMGGEL